jgi:enterochelin esterase family protein
VHTYRLICIRHFFAIALLGAPLACAQETISANQAIEREITIGAVHSYIIRLVAGDYVAGLLSQHGTTLNFTIFLPDGSQLRRFVGIPDRASPFAFVAETPGAFRLEVTGAGGDPTGGYELRLTEILSVSERMRSASSRHEQYSSPRIEALRKEISMGNTDTGEFWRRVEQEGTPLVEIIEHDEQNRLVTFLWRAHYETHNVLVAGDFPLRDISNYYLTQLENTDVWYLTVRLPSGARFVYWLSPNDPLTIDGPNAVQRYATLQADPLNPNRWQCEGEASKFDCSSRVELPGAIPQPWTVHNEEVASGNLEKHVIQSELLGNEHEITTYTPANYQPRGSSYPLLILFDRDTYIEQIPTPVILDNLIAASKIPPVIAVLISFPELNTRNKELQPNPEFADFLVKEFVPWIHAHYNVVRNSRRTIIGGASLGGLFSSYAALRHPDVFGNVLCQSGSFQWAPDHSGSSGLDPSTETNWLAKQFISSSTLPLRFYMDAGIFEVDLNGTGGSNLEASRHFRDVLLARGYEVHYQQFVGGHDGLSWRGTLADGLISLLGDPSQ